MKLLLIIIFASFLFSGCENDKKQIDEKHQKSSSKIDQNTAFQDSKYFKTAEGLYFDNNAHNRLTQLLTEISSTFTIEGLNKRNKGTFRFINDLKSSLENFTAKQKTYYNKSVDFFVTPYMDTTVESKIDYTGDNIPESVFTRLIKDGPTLKVELRVVANQDTIYSSEHTPVFIPDEFPIPNLYSDWNFLLKSASPITHQYTSSNWPDYSYSNMANDAGKYLKKPTANLTETMKEYCNNFKGVVLHFSFDESGGCGYVWYKPLNKFLKFYCP